jgi:UDP-N-acetylmuramyl pentapeptide synthase
MKAAIDVLAANQGHRIFVMGDMAELGEDAAKMHAEIGAYAKVANIETFYALGKLTPEAVKAFGALGRHFESVEALVDALKKQMNSDVTVLIKGSRSARMERVVDLIQAVQTTGNNKGKH